MSLGCYSKVSTSSPYRLQWTLPCWFRRRLAWRYITTPARNKVLRDHNLCTSHRYLKGLYTIYGSPQEIASTYYLCKNSGKDSVDSCLDSPECWEGTESNLELVLLSKLDLDPVAVLAVLLWALLMRELTDSEYFSPKPLICRVSAVWNVKTHFKDNWIKSSHYNAIGLTDCSNVLKRYISYLKNSWQLFRWHIYDSIVHELYNCSQILEIDIF